MGGERRGQRRVGQAVGREGPARKRLGSVWGQPEAVPRDRGPEAISATEAFD